MKRMRLSEMRGGWFIGDFQPAILQTSSFEVGVKHYRAGDYESAHVHKIATEVTLILMGRVRMGGVELDQGEIILLTPGEACDFLALEDTVTAVIKTPSKPNDKYPAANE